MTRFLNVPNKGTGGGEIPLKEDIMREKDGAEEGLEVLAAD